MRTPVLLLVTISLLAATGCSRSTAEASGAAAETDSIRPVTLAAPKRPVVTIPQGTPFEVRLEQAITTAQHRSGDHFDASLAVPITVNGKVVLPEGTRVQGVVRDSKPFARAGGRAVLTVALASIQVRGKTVPLSTSSKTQSTSRRNKNKMTWVGGESGSGAAIGALAAEGAQPANGAAALSGGVGGKKHMGIPPEALMTFRLQRPVQVGG